LKSYALISPNGKEFRGYNLCEFVRDHAHLFATADLAWHGNGCAAIRGLNALRPTLSKPASWRRSKSWKGWRWAKNKPLKSARSDGRGHWPAGRSRSSIPASRQEKLRAYLRQMIADGLSRHEIARRCKVSEKTVRRWLAGRGIAVELPIMRSV
jgi:hypothetical protein